MGHEATIEIKGDSKAELLENFDKARTQIEAKIDEAESMTGDDAVGDLLDVLRGKRRSSVLRVPVSTGESPKAIAEKVRQKLEQRAARQQQEANEAERAEVNGEPAPATARPTCMERLDELWRVANAIKDPTSRAHVGIRLINLQMNLELSGA